MLCMVVFAHPGISAGRVIFTGICEPSGAVSLPETIFADSFLVANDEDNILRVYRTLEGGAPVDTFDLDELIQPAPEREADLEGATWLDGKAYWIGLHSRNGDGKRRKDRRQFFATSITAGTGPTIALDPPVSLHTLSETLSGIDATLRATIRLDVDEDVSLAPDNGGFNIEGLSATVDGTGILIGLRSPQTPTGKAIVISLADPTRALVGEVPQLDLLDELDLDGRGIRSMEVVPALGSYFIVAGPVSGTAPFALYRWNGIVGTDPVEIPGFSAALAGQGDFTPEAMIPSQDGTQILVLSDDGDVCPSPPSFRGLLIDID
jgi:hypothetical protein